MFQSTRTCVCATIVVTACLVAPHAGFAQTPTPADEARRSAADAATSTSPELRPAAGGSAFPRASIFDDLFAGTVRDLQRLPSKQTMTWMGVALVAAQATHFADSVATKRMTTSGAMDGTLGPGETLGGARMQFGGALATYAIGRMVRNDKIAGVGGELFRAQLITQGLTTAVKLSVRRDRPDGTQYSFPSGHTSTSFASAAVLHRELGWKVGMPAYGFASYVALSRVQAKRHFLSDVAFGAALGILVGRTVTVGHGDARFAVAPMATPGGAGIGFTLVGSR